MDEIKLLIRFEKYIWGELSVEEVDELWIEFLKEPEKFDYFLTYLNLYDLL